jgi:hypothetical protein
MIFLTSDTPDIPRNNLMEIIRVYFAVRLNSGHVNTMEFPQVLWGIGADQTETLDRWFFGDDLLH